MKKKFLSLVLALTMLLSLAACGGGNNDDAAGNNPGDQVADNPNAGGDTPGGDAPDDTAGTGEFQPMSYDDKEVYTNALGEFYDALTAAKKCTDVDEMYAMMAIAEAKLQESVTMAPYYSDGGSWGISRVVPRTAPSVYWGSDIDRFETYLVTTELIKAEDRKALISLWNDLHGTGTYEEEARKYLDEHGYTLKDSYGWNGYAADPETWDTLSAWTNTVGEPVCNTVDGLVKYDMENVIQPALAESWEWNETDLTWTFHLREGAVWTDSQGRKLDDVKADDWVASLQHLLDWYGSSAAEVVAPIIVNALEYVSGEVTDFSQVGVEAVDDRTLVYHLTRAVPAFESMLTYCGMFAPLCRSYYESQGGTFGMDTHDNGSYGTSKDNLAYCGPYLITSYTAKNSIVFEANPSYWNLDNMNVTKITWPYYDGQDPTKSYDDCIAGVNDATALNPSALIKAKEEGNFDDYAITSSLTGTSRTAFFNLNRQTFAVYNEETAGVSPQTHESVDGIDRLGGVVTSDVLDDAARTHRAINNQNFRLAMMFGWDRASYHAQMVGDELKYVSLRNGYVPGNFVSLSKDVTIKINGADKTFPAGTYFGEIVQAQVDADGYPFKVWDPEGDNGVGSGDGFDGWYNVENAREYMAKAVEELAAQGVEVSAENPIQIDYYYYVGSESMTNRANAYLQSITDSLEGLVKVNIVGLDTFDQLNNTSFWNPTGADNCVDIGVGQAWSADYADPASYLDTLLPDGDGYMCKALGLWGG